MVRRETFCLFGPHRETRAGKLLALFLGAVNRTYGTDFKLTGSHGHDGCPEFTTIYVLIGPPVASDPLADILEALGGSRPPATYMSRFAGLRGFAQGLPGNRRREFIYVDDTVPPVHSNPDPVRSIMIEETVHALTTLGDFETDSTMVSVLGKTLDFTYYDDWFDSNPRGLCAADLILLEMQVGRALGRLSRRGGSLEWLEEHSHALREILPTLRTELAEFTDERCQ